MKRGYPPLTNRGKIWFITLPYFCFHGTYIRWGSGTEKKNSGTQFTFPMILQVFRSLMSSWSTAVVPGYLFRPDGRLTTTRLINPAFKITFIWSKKLYIFWIKRTFMQRKYFLFRRVLTNLTFYIIAVFIGVERKPDLFYPACHLLISAYIQPGRISGIQPSKEAERRLIC